MLENPLRLTSPPFDGSPQIPRLALGIEGEMIVVRSMIMSICCPCVRIDKAKVEPRLEVESGQK